MRFPKTVLAAALMAAPALAQCLTITNPQPGTNLGLTDDSGRVVALPFPFPFNGQVYTQISICSNGYLWLGARPTGPWPFTDTEADFLSQPERIAPCWEDWNPAAAQTGGGVFYRANASAANIVWRGIPRFASTTLFCNMECVLLPGGVIIFHYEPTMSTPNSTSITGITRGNGAPPSPLSWTTYPLVANATGYELFATNVFTLTGTTLLLSPTSPTAYQANNVTGGLSACTPLVNYPPLASSTTYGAGCPNPTTAGTGTFYEFFANGAIDLSGQSIQFTAIGNNQYVAAAGPGFDSGYAPGDALTQGDDTQVIVSTTAMGGFPFLGAVVTSLASSSNGFLWMTPNTGNPFTATAAAFATQNPRIAPAWGDWNFNQGGTGIGTFYWTATATHCMATWENVPAFGRTGTQNTFQVKLLPNGDIVFSYGAILNNSTTGGGAALVGLSGGGSTQPTASIDIGAVIATPAIANLTPYNLLPLHHSVASAPVLGGPYVLQADTIPAGTVLGAFVTGFTQYNPGTSLAGFGMPGCFQYTSADFVAVVLVSGPTMSFTMNIPAVPAFGGIILNSQAATFSGITPLGVITSNGVQGTVGI